MNKFLKIKIRSFIILNNYKINLRSLINKLIKKTLIVLFRMII